jgi:hypothetical protein
MEMKAKLEAAGIKTDFTIMDTAPASQVATDDDNQDVGNIEQTSGPVMTTSRLASTNLKQSQMDSRLEFWTCNPPALPSKVRKRVPLYKSICSRLPPARTTERPVRQ